MATPKLKAVPKPPSNQKNKVAVAPVQRAVEFMIEAEDYRMLRATLLSAVKKQKHIPMQFAGDMAVLNPLLDLAVSKPAAFEKVFDTIVARRREMAYEKEVERQAGRADYMRDYMREYRKKMRAIRQNPPSKRSISDSVKGAMKDEE